MIPKPKMKCHKDLVSFQKPRNVSLLTETVKYWSSFVVNCHLRVPKLSMNVSC